MAKAKSPNHFPNQKMAGYLYLVSRAQKFKFSTLRCQPGCQGSREYVYSTKFSDVLQLYGN